MGRIRPRLTYANVMSTIAVFLVLGGGAAFAATQLPAGSVDTRELAAGAVSTPKIQAEAVRAGKIAKDSIAWDRLRDDSVTGAKVRSGSLQASDFAAGQLPAGPQGPAGPAGPEGPEGPAGSSAFADQLIASRDDLALNDTTVIDDWTVTVDAAAAFDPVTGVYAAPVDGTYMVLVGADGGLIGPSTISVGGGTGPYQLQIMRDAALYDQRSFPMLDVNVALVLSLRTPLRDAGAQLTAAIPLTAGEELTFRIHPQGISAAASFDADLFIGRLAE